MGSMMVAFSEALALAEVSGLQQKDVVEIAGLGAVAAPMYKMKASSIVATTGSACGEAHKGLTGCPCRITVKFAMS